MVFLFVSLACFALSAAVFAATFAIDHFAAAWEGADPATKRGRFTAWATGNRTLTEIKGWSGIAVAASCLAALCGAFYALTFVGVGGERQFAVYVTGGPNAASPRLFYANQSDLSRMPMFQYVDSRRIVAGTISSVMPIGGGLAHVCVANGDYCGLADSSLGLKVGDTAYIRIGRPPASPRRAPGWAITAAEAKSLESGAKFSIENR
ncbi:MAG TPA: hypothetical protein VMU19_00375 [Bryobacteraceae bacterium]|nr:hypothetical protein [Bryobacteraceae bacterium]